MAGYYTLIVIRAYLLGYGKGTMKSLAQELHERELDRRARIYKSAVGECEITLEQAKVEILRAEKGRLLVPEKAKLYFAKAESKPRSKRAR